MVYELIDFCNEIFDTSEGSSTYGFLSNYVEPDLDLIEPGSISWRIVYPIARASCEPTLDFVMLMSCVIVHYQMDV